MNSEDPTIVREVRREEIPQLFGLIGSLLAELGDEASALEGIDTSLEQRFMDAYNKRHFAFFALHKGDVAGFITVAEFFAVYAGGASGIINELYVKPGFRSHQIGKALLEKAAGLGRQRQWKRIDVTTPTGSQWIRTVQFYEKNGFVFTGKKLKYEL